MGILFLIVCGYIGLFNYAQAAGNPQYTYGKPFDPDHKACGIDLPDYPFIYFVTPQDGYLWRTVCVKSCPSSNDTALSCSPNSVVKSCNANLSPSSPND